MAVAERDIHGAGHVIAPAERREADRLRRLAAHPQGQAPGADRRERGGQACLGARAVEAREVHAGDLDARQDAALVRDRQADQERGGGHEGQGQAKERPAEEAPDPAARPGGRRLVVVTGARLGKAEARDGRLEAGCCHGFTAAGA